MPDPSVAISWIHIGASVVAVITGPLVLLLPKGDLMHRRIGSFYVLSMGLLNLTAFLIYRLFGVFGPFHVAAIISLVTLLAGVLPLMRKPRRVGWAVKHMTYMLWSVIGLYAAFISEILVRSPWRGASGIVVAIATVVLIVLGLVVQGPLVRRWSRQLRSI